jgi:hypothetical protein
MIDICVREGAAMGRNGGLERSMGMGMGMGMDMDWIRWFILTLNSKMRDGVLFWFGKWRLGGCLGFLRQ